MIISLVTFIAGFFSNRLLSDPAKVDDDAALECNQLNSAKSNLISISQNEYLEYAKIKDLKQKYEKADELLGKIMLLFLADLGFKAEKGQLPEAAIASESDARPQNMKPIVESVAAPSAITQAPQNDSSLAGKSSLIRNLGNEAQIRKLLDQAIIEDLKIESAKGGVPSRQQTKRLEGRYTGAIKFFDRKTEDLFVIWDLVPDYSKNDFSGSFSLSIRGPSMNSESNGNGSIQNIVRLADDPDGFLVNACGGDCYLQLYYNSAADRFVGNYYGVIKGTNRKPSRLGFVELRK